MLLDFGVGGFAILHCFIQWLRDMGAYSVRSSAPDSRGIIEEKTPSIALVPPFAGPTYGQYTVSPVR